jgi:hypothetical protein
MRRLFEALVKAHKRYFTLVTAHGKEQSAPYGSVSQTSVHLKEVSDEAAIPKFAATAAEQS